MENPVAKVEGLRPHACDLVREAAAILAGSFLVAVCARIFFPLPGTPVPLTCQNLAVLVVGLALGSRSGFVALLLYLAEGAAGLPVFSPTGPGGLLQLVGPTGGYLLAYPLAAGLTGYLFERGRPTFYRAAVAAITGELVVFSGGISWLFVLTHSLSKAVGFGLFWFVFAEIIKVMLAAGTAREWHRRFPRGRLSDRGLI